MKIETARLLLREMEQTDFSDLAEILQDPEVMAAYEHDFSHEDVQEWLNRQKRRYREYGFGLWAMILKETGEMIGQAGLTMQPCEGSQVLEIGYLLKKKFWHRGYAREAALACKEYAFENLGAEKVYSIIKWDNEPSMGVARAIGMEKEKDFMARYYNGDVRHCLFSVCPGVRLRTDRLLLREFTKADAGAFFAIMQDEEVNTFLPWFPVKTLAEAEEMLREQYLEPTDGGLHLAICLKEDNVPIGYVNISGGEAHDLGYGLRKEFWHMGIVTEAAKAMAEEAKRRGFPFLTATHDVKNPRSGGVMRNIGMKYCYTYEEVWQPKNFPVHFRMYQLNLDGDEARVYRGYWEKYPHFMEEGL